MVLGQLCALSLLFPTLLSMASAALRSARDMGLNSAEPEPLDMGGRPCSTRVCDSHSQASVADG